MPEQRGLPLINGLQSTLTRAGNGLLEAIERVVTLHIPKRVVLAEQIGIKEQHLNDALHGNGKHFAARWLPHVALHDREHRIARLVAGWHDLNVSERMPLTDAEWRKKVEAALRRAGRAGDAILADALDEEKPLIEEETVPR